MIPAILRDLSGKATAPVTPIRKDLVRIGRDAGANDVVIPERTVTTVHAEIRVKNGGYFLRDCKSTNGTYLNGRKFSDPRECREVPLQSGDRIRVDAFEFEFLLDEGLAPSLADPVDAPTIRKKSSCPVHPDRPATEFCYSCKREGCPACIRERNGERLCGECAAKERPA